MAFGFKRSTSGDDRLESIEAIIQRMFNDDRVVFDLAMSILLDGVDWKSVRREIKVTDQRVNEGEREVRRDLVVHASVVGAIDTPAILVYMSIVKDIERIGDYGKNLRDLGRDGVDLSDFPAWHELRSEIDGLIAETAETFADRDEARARQLLVRGDELLDEFDKTVSSIVRGDDDRPNGVGRALAARYLKRIVAHLTNVLSAIVMPLERLDYFDEDPEDRE
ncbi:MAG: phosphate uptake regulator PhoU [Nitriliruptor sp.]|nr:MAG: phosphate uptake regulator PhoU [Nitriliruptor sp.]